MNEQVGGAAGGLRPVSGWAYGVRVTGRLPGDFEQYLRQGGRGSAPAEDAVRITYGQTWAAAGGEEIWVEETSAPGFRGRYALRRLSSGIELSVDAEGRGAFLIAPDRISIDWQSGDGTVAAYFFSHALPLWLETRGVPVLHASAVSRGGVAVGLLGPSGAGKSTLCAELIRAGWDFVADDGLAVRPGKEGGWRCSHGPPFLRLWPSALTARLGVEAGKLPRVYDRLEKRRMPPAPATLEPAAGCRLAALYVLGRNPHGAAVEFSLLRAARSLARLIEFSLAAGPAEALGLAPGRFDLLTGLAAAVPVFRLGFPSGADSIAAIHERLTGDTLRTSGDRERDQRSGREAG